MHTHFSLRLLSLGLILILSCSAWASRTNKEFANLSSELGSPNVNINLGAPLLALAKLAIPAEDKEAAALLESVSSVSVQVFNAPKNMKDLSASVQKFSQKAAKDQWETLISVNEDKEKVRILVKLKEEVIQGLLLIVLNTQEAVFIQVEGQITPDRLALLAQNLDFEQHIPQTIQ